MTAESEISINPTEIDPSKQYRSFEVDQEHLIRSNINAIFDTPIRKLEEHIDNAKDAQANNVTIIINMGTTGTKGFGCEDDGRGIPDPQKVFKYGSNHKLKEKEENPSIDQTGRWGEGAKGTLSIADYIEYRSNYGGERDMFIRLRTPNKWPINQCVLIDDERRKGTLKPTMGTRVLAYPIDYRQLKAMVHELPDHTAKKFAWLMATKDLLINVVIVDDKDRRKEYCLEVPPIFRPLFEDYPKKKVTLDVIKDDDGREHLIELIHTNADKKNERMIFYASSHRIVKAVPTEYNAVVVVNCNGLPLTKDRSGFDQSHRISQEIISRVESYLAKNYQKASTFSNLTQTQREQHHRVLEELNKLAEEQGLIGPKDMNNNKKIGEGEVNPEVETAEEWLRTTRTTEPAELRDADLLWQKRPGRVSPFGIYVGGNEPGQEGQVGGQNSVELDPLAKRKVLVQEVVEDKRRKKQQWAVRAKIMEAGQKGHKRTIKTGFFAIATHEDSDPNVSVTVGRLDQRGIIWLNMLGNFFKLHKPNTFPRPEYDLKDVLPLIAEGATEILYGVDMPVAEYKQRYGILLHKLCALFLPQLEQPEQKQE
jgi:hypothetical protein